MEGWEKRTPLATAKCAPDALQSLGDAEVLTNCDCRRILGAAEILSAEVVVGGGESSFGIANCRFANHDVAPYF